MTKTDARLVSVVIPVFNGLRYLPEALQSIRRQTRPADEIILVDDGSTDGSGAYIDSLDDKNIVVCHQENAGQAAARNAGIEKSRGDFIALLDCDDLWEPEKLELQLAKFAANPKIDIVTCRFIEFYSPDLAPEIKAATRLTPGVLTGPNCSNLLVKRQVLQNLAAFDPALRTGELIDWWARVTEAGVVTAEIDLVLTRRRIHDRNLGRQAARDRGDYLHIVKNLIQRRRRAAAGQS